MPIFFGTAVFRTVLNNFSSSLLDDFDPPFDGFEFNLLDILFESWELLFETLLFELDRLLFFCLSSASYVNLVEGSSLSSGCGVI